MKARFLLAAVAISALAFAPAALADDHNKHGKGAEKAAEHAAEQAEEKLHDAHQRAEEARTRAAERADAAHEHMEDKGRGAEMRERRDERKEIMSEAKAAHEPGTPQAGKKPWWKFWGE